MMISQTESPSGRLGKAAGRARECSKKNGGCLLSHLRSTIGAAGLNFSVRNGKRWDPGAKPP